jgi:IclR family transcriptional regulator, KDG regulon repressor
MKENRSVNRILAILELIARHDEGLTLGEIYRTLQIPKATVYDFLQTLYKLDAIYYKDPRLKNYVIGSKMFAIGSVYTKNSNFIEAAQHELKEFAQKHGRTVFISKRINEKIVYVFKHQPTDSKINTPQEIGTVSRDFAHDTVGKCYAYFDRYILNDKLPNFDIVRKNRYLYSDEDSSNGYSHICTLTAPVWNFEKRVVGVIAAMDLQLEETNRKVLAKEFVQIAENISRRLGYMSDFSD